VRRGRGREGERERGREGERERGREGKGILLKTKLWYFPLTQGHKRLKKAT
jgi:hypothetical protein